MEFYVHITVLFCSRSQHLNSSFGLSRPITLTNVSSCYFLLSLNVNLCDSSNVFRKKPEKSSGLPHCLTHHSFKDLSFSNSGCVCSSWLSSKIWVLFISLWKILKEMGIPDHLASLLRNLYAGQEATVTTGHETTDWF